MKNFIFDLYGTLVDIRTDESGKKFKTQVEKYFAAYGVQNFWDKYQRLCAESSGGKLDEFDLFTVFRRILVNADERTVLHSAQYFRKKSRSKLKVYGGVYPLLKKLKSAGAGVYLLTNAQSCFTLGELEELKLSRYFDGILISSDFGKKKPAKEFFAGILDKYSIDPAHAVYVGNDFCADIEGAKAVGLHTAYIKSNISPVQDSLEEAAKTADFATDSFKQLAAYLIEQSKLK